MSNLNQALFDFEKLIVYQKSLDLVDNVYSLCDSHFPAKEMYGLSSQFKRASYSISLNIGEGSGGSRKEFIQFLTISKRSVRECIVCTTIAYRRCYITNEINNNLRAQLTEISKMLNGLIGYLESDKGKSTLSEPNAEYVVNSKTKKQTRLITKLTPNSEPRTPNKELTQWPK